jgi:hypothetical protein
LIFVTAGTGVAAGHFVVNYGVLAETGMVNSVMPGRGWERMAVCESD